MPFSIGPTELIVGLVTVLIIIGVLAFAFINSRGR